MRLNKSWTTHIPMILKYVQKSDKPVLELGAGLFSTPLLHWICKENGVNLRTYENVKEYFKFSKSFQSRKHRIRLISDWDEVENNDTFWSVVFIDHAPAERRHIDAIRFANKADYVILHDSDTHRDIYQYDKVYPHFKYRYDWKECSPHTTVLSNFKEL